MTITIAVTGKSGSGKTTFVKSLVTTLQAHYPDKSLLLVDNDLTLDLAGIYGIDINKNLNAIRIGKYSYRPSEKMQSHEVVEWAVNDLVSHLYDETDLLVVGPISTKVCTCKTDRFIEEAMIDLIRNYDMVIFDCEYDLEHLYKLVDYPLDVSLIIADTSASSVRAAENIMESSLRFSAHGQTGVILNKVKDNKVPENISALLIEHDMKILGMLPYDRDLEEDNLVRESEVLVQAVDELLFRLNLSILGS